MNPDDSTQEHTLMYAVLTIRAIPLATERTVNGFDGRLCLSWLGPDLFVFEGLRTLTELCLPEPTIHSTSDSHKFLVRSLFRDLTISQYDDMV
jgi:hypothetical protein